MSGFNAGMDKAKQSWQDFGRAAQVASVPIGLALAKGVSDASQFDSAMGEISARTGTTGKDLDAVRELAIKMGRDTMFSAQDSANAMLELMASGDSVEQAMARLPHVLTLAAAGGLDLKTSADGLTDVMASMRVDIEYSGDVIQTLSSAASSSSADVQSLIDGFGNVGPVAKDMGLTVRDTASALAVMAENGIKGSDAGTALRSILLNINRPTADVLQTWNELGLSFYDAEGNLRDFNTILVEMDAALDTRTPQEQNEMMHTLAGSYGITGLSALRAAGGLNTMQESMMSQVSAADVAEARMNTFEGKVDSLKGSIETLNIVAFTPFMNNVLVPIVGQITDVVNALTDFAGDNPETTQTVITLAAAFVGGTAALTSLGLVVNLVKTGMLALKATGFLPLAGVLAVGAGLVLAYMNNWGGFRDFVDTKLRPVILKIIDDLGAWRGAMQDVQTIVKGINSGKYSVQDTLTATKDAIQSEIEGANRTPGQRVNSAVAPIASNALLNPMGYLLGQAMGTHGGGTAQLLDTLDANRRLQDAPLSMGEQTWQEWLGSLYRADGGPVVGGEPYIVGERGPELFVPEQSGMIQPNTGKGITVNVYTSATNGRDMGEDIARELTRQGFS